MFQAFRVQVFLALKGVVERALPIAIECVGIVKADPDGKFAEGQTVVSVGASSGEIAAAILEFLSRMPAAA
jgi:hypothetical protein